MRSTTDRYIFRGLDIFDVAGKSIAKLVDNVQTAGPHQVDWNGVNDWGATMSSGVYFYVLHLEDRVIARKMVFLK